MSLSTFLRSLLSGSKDGAEVPVVESRCYAWVTLTNGLMANVPRERHQWKKRGVVQPACVRCGEKNPRYKEATA